MLISTSWCKNVVFFSGDLRRLLYVVTAKRKKQKTKHKHQASQIVSTRSTQSLHKDRSLLETWNVKLSSILYRSSHKRSVGRAHVIKTLHVQDQSALCVCPQWAPPESVASAGQRRGALSSRSFRKFLTLSKTSIPITASEYAFQFVTQKVYDTAHSESVDLVPNEHTFGSLYPICRLLFAHRGRVPGMKPDTRM